MGGIQSTHEPEVKMPVLTDNILPEHQNECTTMGDVLVKCGEALKSAKTYQEVKDALNAASAAAEATAETGLLDIVHLEVKVEEHVHNGPTGAEGQE